MLYLDESLFIGKGFHKATYMHPQDTNLCIKVMINSNVDAVKQLKRELKHNTQLQNKNASLKALSAYIGTQRTNLGQGYLFEIVRDYNKNISKSLSEYLVDADFVANNVEQIITDLEILKQRMIEQRIVPMDILPHNILYKKTKLAAQRKN